MSEGQASALAVAAAHARGDPLDRVDAAEVRARLSGLGVPL
jgi:hypothetical protein